MSSARAPKRLLVAAFGDAGHAFPAIGLARELQRRGHTVAVETWEKWRDPVEAEGLDFRAAEGYTVFPPPGPDSGDPSAGEAALALLDLIDELEPDLVISDILTLAPSLAAEKRGVPHATLIPHIYPVHEPGLPFFAFGVHPPRSPIGQLPWRVGRPVLETGLRRGRRDLNAQRETVGLAPQDRLNGGISERLALVGTFPQLEYPRAWPAHVEVTGPIFYEMPHPDVEIPEGDDPLILIAASTVQDPEGALVRRSLDALADEPVRVLATTNGQRPEGEIDVPGNARLVDWLSYSQVLPEADLMICHGGHGTVCRSLAAGVPVLISPAQGDMTETGCRVGWSGCGLMLPKRLTHAAPLRWAVRKVLADQSIHDRAAELAGWATVNDGASSAADAIEHSSG